MKPIKSILLIIVSLFCLFGYSQKSKYNFIKIDSIGVAIDTSLKNLDESYLNSIFDKDAFFLKIFGKEEGDELTTYEEAFKEGGKSSLNIAKEILKGNENNGSYDYLNFFLDSDKNFHLIFRLSGDDGLNYHDFLLKEKNGEFVITDFLIYLSGEFLSVTMQNIYQGLVFENHLEKKNQLYLNSLINAKKMRELISNEEYKKAYKLLEKIPEKIQKNKVFQILAINITSNISDKLYVKAITEYENLYPNDPSLNLLSIDVTLIRKEYDKTLFYVNRLDEILDGDSYLNLYRGYVYYLKEDYKKAIIYYENVKDNYPNIEVAYENLLYSYVKLKRYDAATKIVEDFIEIFYYVEVEFIKYIKKDYPKLYKSKAFKNWLVLRKTTQKN